MSNSKIFADKVVVVTGGTRGIGAEISRKFAEQGARVVMIYRSNHAEAVSLTKSLSGQFHTFYQADITNPHEVSAIIDKIITQYGRIDIAVNNAGIGYHHPVDQSDYGRWQSSWTEIINTNLIGPSNLSHQVAQIMIKQGSGHIINVSSRGAFRGEPLMPAYGASKAGLNSMTQSLAYSLAPHGIFVGAVAPGFVETDMSRPRLQGSVGDGIKAQSPMNRVAQPEEVAHAVLVMAQSNAWMTGGIFDVNGASYFRT